MLSAFETKASVEPLSKQLVEEETPRRRRGDEEETLRGRRGDEETPGRRRGDDEETPCGLRTEGAGSIRVPFRHHRADEDGDRSGGKDNGLRLIEKNIKISFF